ncbi:MAG: hypothetical protein AAF984_00880 [Verrucomicrobiota bacterium]
MKTENKQNLYGVALTVLWGLFLFRVLAQLVQSLFPTSFLPAFDQWHSGTLPYPVLVIFQVVILLVCLKVIIDFFQGKVSPLLLKGKLFALFGMGYFGVMIGRLLTGIIYPDAHSWFLVKIPTIFHLVLASFLIVMGHYHLRYARVRQ